MKTPTNNGVEALADIFPWNLAVDVYQVQSGDLAKRYEALARVNSLGLVKALDTLTDRERRILLRRYQDCATYERIGEECSVGRERIRQIESRAIRKLRHPARRELYEPVTREEYHQLRQDYWELVARYERVKEEALEEAMRNMYDAEGQIAAAKREFAAQEMATPIEELELSVRSYNCLLRAGVKTVSNLASMPLDKLERVRNLGKKSLEETLGRLKAFGITPRYEDGSTYEDKHRRSR